MTPIGSFFDLIWAAMSGPDASPEQDGDQHEDAVEGCDPAACGRERSVPVAAAPEVIDLRERAAKAVYGRGPLLGKSKRSAYPPVALAGRRVVIVLHQMGVEVPAKWPSWWKVTAHGVVRTDGAALRLHPANRRLMASNRVDRAPWHGLGIEFAVNAEGLDGSGNWYAPERNGRGRVSDRQVEGGRALVDLFIAEVAAAGGEVVGILPHITTGRDSRGRPNRQICPGSRIWSEVGEWAGAERGLAIPAPDWKLGGLVVPPSWRGRFYAKASGRFIDD